MKSQFERIEDDAEKLHRIIQLDLANLYFEVSKATNGQFAEWIEKFALNFRRIISDHPEYLALYASNRVEALDKIEKDLYLEDNPNETN